MNESKVTCMICKAEKKYITPHLKKHNINSKLYKELFPDSEMTSKEVRERISAKHKGKVIKEEVRLKISKTQTGKKLSLETLEKRQNYYRLYGHPSKGKKLSEQARENISLASIGRVPWNKGKPWSEDIRKRISEKLKGRKLSEEVRSKMSISRKGRKLSEITRKKLSLAKKGKPVSLEHKNKIIEALDKSPNKFEIRCIELFKEHNLPIKFVGDFNDKNFFIGGKVPDFVSTNGRKILVEVFYDYFKIKQYGSIENYKKDRVETFSKNGWKTLFFTYKEIMSDPEKCINVIKGEIR